jgi:hypothetical protein
MHEGALSRLGVWLRGLDVWGLLAALAALVVFLAHGFQGILSRDLGVYAYGAEQAADGVPPYVSILNRAGPLAHLVPGVGAWVARGVGVDQLLGMRLMMMVLSVAAVWALYLLGRDLLCSRLAGLVSAVSLLAFQGFTIYATGGPREKTTMLLFLICCLWAVTRRRWLWAGVCLALAALAWQPVFFVGGVSVVVGVAGLRARELVRALTSVVVGGAIPTVLCVLAYAAVGALPELLEGYVLVNARYTAQTGIGHFLSHSGISALERGFGLSLWLILFGVVFILVAACARLAAARSGRAAADVAVVATGAACLVGLLWCLRAFNGWPDAMVLLPMAALGLGAAARAVIDRSGSPLGVRLVAVAVSVLMVAALAGSIQTRTDKLELQRASIRRILAAAPAAATIRSMGAPQALVLTDRTNRSRHQMFRGGLEDYVDDTYPGGLNGFVDEIEEERPTFITLDNKRSYPWLAPTLDHDYTFVYRSPGWSWFVRRDLGPEAIARIQTAARATSRVQAWSR